MTKKEIKEVQEKINRIEKILIKECPTRIKVIIAELVEMELQLEAECNQ